MDRSRPSSPTPTPDAPKDLHELSFHLGNLTGVVHSLAAEAERREAREVQIVQVLQELPTQINDRIDARLAEQDERIRKLELWQKYVAGAIGIVAFLVSSGWVYQMFIIKPPQG